jgi:hypothetical protein
MIIVGGVKVLIEKTGHDDNFQNERMCPESFLINLAILTLPATVDPFSTHHPFSF